MGEDGKGVEGAPAVPNPTQPAPTVPVPSENGAGTLEEIRKDQKVILGILGKQQKDITDLHSSFQTHVHETVREEEEEEEEEPPTPAPAPENPAPAAPTTQPAPAKLTAPTAPVTRPRVGPFRHARKG